MRLLKVTEDMNQVVTQIGPVKQAVESYATVLTCLVEFNSIEQALALQDDSDRKAMQLLGSTKRLKIPENNAASDNSIFGDVGKDNISISSAFQSRHGPLKATSTKNQRGISNPKSSRARNLLQSNLRTANEQADMEGVLNSLSIESEETAPMTKMNRTGPIRVKESCLSCAGVPSHTMDLFKLACIQYQPSNVLYRNNNMTRKRLLGMRKTLIDKCEEVIN